mmetsp:Transcript_26477/g.46009  ORF Transcript_26477/g.46009 Transcript_26477/m.46009 type:complete len:112 (+) Transcript_26477:51-386(+)
MTLILLTATVLLLTTTCYCSLSSTPNQQSINCSSTISSYLSHCNGSKYRPLKLASVLNWVDYFSLRVAISPSASSLLSSSGRKVFQVRIPSCCIRSEEDNIIIFPIFTFLA